MTAVAKETIYIDVDDEITNIIDKVRGSDKKIIALVLPKRAAVLQSIVNMKLLKRTADNEAKKVVLITSEAGLLPLAGAVGLHVAKNLQSKPAIPTAPTATQAPEPQISEDELEEAAPSEPVDKSKTVGELSGAAAVGAAVSSDEDDEPIELDDPEPAAAAGTSGTKKAAKKGDKKIKIPNFDKFRLWLMLGGAAIILLAVGIYLALFAMPKAKITIKTDSTTVNANIPFTASTTATTLDADKKIVPAERKETKKTNTQKVAATGQKNNGAKATGTVKMSTQVCGSFTTPSSVPSGTGVSANGHTYITQETASFSPGSISGGCVNFSSNDVSITAQNPGAAYNTGSSTFTVAGRSDVSATGSASGGTDAIVKVVSQADVDSAKQKLAESNSQTAEDELAKNLEKDTMIALKDTFNVGDPEVTTTPNVGDEASEVTVTSTTKYSMLGVNKDDLKKLVTENAKTQIDTSKQSILDDGLADASYVIQGDKNAAQVKITVQSIVKAGPQLDAEGIKKEIAGKKKGETKSIIEARPGIKDVTVDYSPFWVGKTPKKTSKITIVFDTPNDNKKP